MSDARNPLLKYELLPAVGPGRIPKAGRLADLLLDIPYFFVGRVTPPIAIVNEVLKTGKIDAGMSGGCEWKPFQIDQSRYDMLVEDLKKRRFRFVKPPEWVMTHSDWHTWCCELVWGIPALESKRRWAEILQLYDGRKTAIKAGNHELAAALSQEASERNASYLRFLNEHRASKPKLPLIHPLIKRKPRML